MNWGRGLRGLVGTKGSGVSSSDGLRGHVRPLDTRDMFPVGGQVYPTSSARVSVTVTDQESRSGSVTKTPPTGVRPDLGKQGRWATGVDVVTVVAHPDV